MTNLPNVIVHTILEHVIDDDLIKRDVEFGLAFDTKELIPYPQNIGMWLVIWCETIILRVSRRSRNTFFTRWLENKEQDVRECFEEYTLDERHYRNSPYQFPHARLMCLEEDETFSKETKHE